VNRPISPAMHGVLDYATVATCLAAPRLLRFPPAATRACDLLAGGYLAMSALTDYPLAAKRAIPFKAHGATEVALGAALPVLPRALGFADHRAARTFFLGLTAVTAMVASLTDWDGSR
jgi:hypothetical protein